MRAVLSTPAWPDWTHLYPDPTPTTAGDDIPASAAEPADPGGDRAGRPGEDPGPGAGEPACRAPVPDLPDRMPTPVAALPGGSGLLRGEVSRAVDLEARTCGWPR